MKKDMMETRAALENTVKLHKESVHKQRAIEAEITVSRSAYYNIIVLQNGHFCKN